ncbi:MAG: glycosyltransferase family 2 protein [Saccharospirillum sp.]
MNTTPRVLLAGIAKNEAAYLPEWCFHHLRSGISGIVVYVNGTTDNTCQVLDKIAINNPVSYKVVDGIESSENEDIMQLIHPNYAKRTPMQAKSYADIYLRTSSDEYDYILYLDIDEYLLPESDLASMLIEQKDSYHFPWFSISGDAEEFDTLVNNLKGEYDNFAKTMIKTGLSRVLFISPHTVISNGQEVKYESKSFVIHRVLRSQTEYKAMILKSTPSVTHRMANGFKLNRKGWTTRYSNVIDREDVMILKNYDSDYIEFIEDNRLQEELRVARDFIIEKSKFFDGYIDELSYLNTEIIKILPGTGLKNIIWSKYFIQLCKIWVIRLFFPSLAVKHLSPLSLIKEKLQFYKPKKFYD